MSKIPQKTLTDFVTIGQEQEESRKQKLRDILLYTMEKGTFNGKCPLCSIELLPIPKTYAHKLYTVDSFLRKFKVLNGCVDCGKVFITRKTLGDLWEEVFTAPEVIQAITEEKNQIQKQQEEAEKYNIKCPNFQCRQSINIKNLSNDRLTTTSKGVVLQCDHCNQLILIPQDKFDRIIGE